MAKQKFALQKQSAHRKDLAGRCCSSKMLKALAEWAVVRLDQLHLHLKNEQRPTYLKSHEWHVNELCRLLRDWQRGLQMLSKCACNTKGFKEDFQKMNRVKIQVSKRAEHFWNAPFKGKDSFLELKAIVEQCLSLAISMLEGDPSGLKSIPLKVGVQKKSRTLWWTTRSIQS